MLRKVLGLVTLVAVVLGTFGSAFAQSELVIWADDTRAPVLEELGKQFEAEFGVAVKVQQLGFGDIRDQFKTAAPAGEGPDIIIGAHDWLGELTQSGLLEPLVLDEAFLANFAPAALQGFTFNSTLYGLPYATENVAFLYNPELVETTPATWDEVFALSQMLVKEGKSKYGFVRQEGDPYHFFPIQTAFGGYVFGFDEDGNYNPEDLGVDSEGSIAALTWWENFVKAGLQPQAVDYDVMHNLFEAGDAAMIVTGPWALDRIRKSGVPYVVSPTFPEGAEGVAGKPFLGVQGFMVSSFSKNKELAVAFLTEFVASEDIEVTIKVGDKEMMGYPMYLLGLSRPSAYLPALQANEDPDFVAYGLAGTEALPMPAIPQMGAVWSSWGNAVTAVTQGTETAADAFTKAAEQIRTQLAGN